MAADPNGPLVFACSVDRNTIGVQVTQACTSTGTTVSGLTARIDPYTFVVNVTDAAGNTTTTPYSWHVYAKTKVTASSVVQSIPQLTAKLTRADGTTPVVGQMLRFTIGQSGNGNAVTCTNGTGNMVPTQSDGTATCKLGTGDFLSVLLSGGFTATFVANPPYFGSSGSAGVLS
jgi:hypothetical protein